MPQGVYGSWPSMPALGHNVPPPPSSPAVIKSSVMYPPHKSHKRRKRSPADDDEPVSSSGRGKSITTTDDADEEAVVRQEAVRTESTRARRPDRVHQTRASEVPDSDDPYNDAGVGGKTEAAWPQDDNDEDEDGELFTARGPPTRDCATKPTPDPVYSVSRHRLWRREEEEELIDIMEEDKLKAFAREHSRTLLAFITKRNQLR